MKQISLIVGKISKELCHHVDGFRRSFIKFHMKINKMLLLIPNSITEQMGDSMEYIPLLCKHITKKKEFR